ncbi:MAG: hypothetical protein GY779_05720 [Gammaproteobacteria bacterium]|nr:hypothetical protein [Gammaproteobacteria bacterium]
MATRDEELLAKEADRLMRDPALLQILDILRYNAIEALVECDPANVNEIIRLQVAASYKEQVLSEMQAAKFAIPTEQEPGVV